MSERIVIDCDKEAFRIAAYVWRNNPVRGPLTGWAMRCIVARDHDGCYWAGSRVRRTNGYTETNYYGHGYRSERKAIELSRHCVRSMLMEEAQCIASLPSQAAAGAVLARTEMDDGWSVAVRSGGAIAVGLPRTGNLADRYGMRDPDMPLVGDEAKALYAEWEEDYRLAKERDALPPKLGRTY